MFNKELSDLTSEIISEQGYAITEAEALKLSEPGRYDAGELIVFSEIIRRRYQKNNIFLCSIINAKSGKCSQDCAFCAQSSFHETEIETYPLITPGRIVDDAFSMHRAGATNFSIVTSGHSLTDGEIDSICVAVKEIKKKTDLTVCGSLGMLSEKNAVKLIDSGMTRYHHNLETAESHFSNICTTHSYQEDIDTVNMALRHGFNVCCGGIFGLGESWEQRVELALTIRSLDVDTIPVNFINPVPGTKLSGMPLVDPMDALRTIALIRFINPEKNITICGGREITLKDFQSRVFDSGANGLMIGNYLTTTGRDMMSDLDMINSLGLRVRKIDET